MRTIRINIVTTERDEKGNTFTAPEAVVKMATEENLRPATLARQLLSESPRLIAWAKKQKKQVMP